MRFDVHKVRCHLVNELMDTPQVKEVWHDGSDVVILDFKTGESAALHIIERYMSLGEIEYILTEDARAGYYSMLILWADMFMPSDGQVYQADDWMVALLQLYGGKIYAYDAWRNAPHIFNVHFQRIHGSHDYEIRHGADVRIGQISIDTIETTVPGFTGFWRVARFDGSSHHTAHWTPPTEHQRSSVRYYFNLLGLNTDATREDVKLAYRQMARKHHPDLNPNEDTTHRMQQINNAYGRIIRYMDGEDDAKSS